MTNIDIILWILGITSTILFFSIIYVKIFTEKDKKIFLITSSVFMFVVYFSNTIYHYNLNLWNVIWITFYYMIWFVLYKTFTNVQSQDKDGKILYLV
jgi:hypothetical protein